MKNKTKAQHIEDIKLLRKQLIAQSCQIDELNQIINRSRNSLNQTISRSRHSAEICKFSLRQAKAQTENIKQTFTFVASFLAMTVAILLLLK